MAEGSNDAMESAFLPILDLFAAGRLIFKQLTLGT